MIADFPGASKSAPFFSIRPLSAIPARVGAMDNKKGAVLDNHPM
jgi:hypothetical protein